VIRVALLALLPFVGNFAGAALAETLSPSDAWRNRALHAAVGIVFAVVAVEIMPEALEVLAGWEIALALLVGGAAYLLAQTIIASRAEGSGRM
jgi:zinc transporter, ZIP family